MTPTPNQSTLTDDGEYSLYDVSPGRDVRLEWVIVEGTATVTPGYVDLLGNFKPAYNLDGTVPTFPAAGGMCDVGIGNSGLAAIKIESASDLVMQICQTLKPL